MKLAGKKFVKTGSSWYHPCGWSRSRAEWNLPRTKRCAPKPGSIFDGNYRELFLRGNVRVHRGRMLPWNLALKIVERGEYSQSSSVSRRHFPVPWNPSARDSTSTMISTMKRIRGNCTVSCRSEARCLVEELNERESWYNFIVEFACEWYDVGPSVSFASP